MLRQSLTVDDAIEKLMYNTVEPRTPSVCGWIIELYCYNVGVA